jgi:histidine triad (HIT) family protein
MASIFTKIMNREIKADIIFEDDLCVAFRDIEPQAPHHFLVVPRKEIRSLADASAEDAHILGHCLVKAGELARQHGFAETGFRTVINTNPQGGQSVYHLHVHVLGGRQMTWPPG